MSICAVVQPYNIPMNTIHVVINKIVAEPTDLPPEGTYLVPCDDVMCDIGWLWDGFDFINPNPPTEEVI